LKAIEPGPEWVDTILAYLLDNGRHRPLMDTYRLPLAQADIFSSHYRRGAAQSPVPRSVRSERSRKMQPRGVWKPALPRRERSRGMYTTQEPDQRSFSTRRPQRFSRRTRRPPIWAGIRTDRLKFTCH
jgi:hypothetical protein